MFRKHITHIFSAMVWLIIVSAPLVFANDQSVGDKVSTPVGTVKVDKGGDGSITVRQNSNSGPSISVQSVPPSRENPQGSKQGTAGWTWETK